MTREDRELLRALTHFMLINASWAPAMRERAIADLQDALAAVEAQFEREDEMNRIPHA